MNYKLCFMFYFYYYHFIYLYSLLLYSLLLYYLVLKICIQRHFMIYIIFSIVFYVCVYGVVMCLSYFSLNSNNCKINQYSL